MSLFTQLSYLSLAYWCLRAYHSVFIRIYRVFFTPEKSLDLKNYGKWCMITGCKNGLGKSFIESLSERNISLVLVGPITENLSDLARDIELTYDIKTKVIDLEMCPDRSMWLKIAEEIDGLEIGMLINNFSSNYAHPEYFLDVDDHEVVFNDIIWWNVVLLTQICRIVMPQMVERRKGVIVNVSSTFAVVPSPLLTVFAASKAFVLKFSKDLAAEYEERGIIVQCLCPGSIASHDERWISPNPKKTKNDQKKSEPLVACIGCKKNFHQICVLHLETSRHLGFTCDECLMKRGQKRRQNEFTAKGLKPTDLSTHIQNRVNNFLKKEDSNADEVVIRVLASIDKVVKVQPRMRTKFVNNSDMPGEFPYRAKASFAFQEIEGTDVCIFGMHVQEYGSQCKEPNTRRIYISYLDSVFFFQGASSRSAVYHEILLGYLEYAKRLGFTAANIWMFPPKNRDDFIFYCHLRDQTFLPPTKLQKWYKKIFKRGISENIIVDYTVYI